MKFDTIDVVKVRVAGGFPSDEYSVAWDRKHGNLAVIELRGLPAALETSFIEAVSEYFASKGLELADLKPTEFTQNGNGDNHTKYLPTRWIATLRRDNEEA